MIIDKMEEVREMRKAETILEIIRERGRKGLPLERVYKLLFNKELWLIAYGKIYRNAGAMTHGVTDETPDGMSLEKIDAIIASLRKETYHWLPARRTFIPKKQGKKRPLGMPVWSDKLLQEVLRLLLEAYYEPQFSEYSHGFRPQRGCHTALREIYRTWLGTAWFIEGDIAHCFDTLSHELILECLQEKIHDGRFIQLVKRLLDAGYMEDWTLHTTLSGVPQGGIMSPLLSNILLNKLDQFVEKVLIPKYTKGIERKGNAHYQRLQTQSRYYQGKGDAQKAKELRRQAQTLPSLDPNDPDYRRLKYVRYADDFLLGFCGPKTEAEEIKQEVREFLSQQLRLELSQAKTLITHARSEAATFLGYEVTVIQDDKKRYRTTKGKNRRSLNGKIGLKIPKDVLETKCKKYLRKGKAIHRPQLLQESDFTIMETYQLEYRGIANYYQLAYNMGRLGKLKYVMEYSLLRTLANKHKTQVSKMVRKYKTEVVVQGKKYKALQVKIPREGKKPLVTTWGGVPLIWNIQATLEEQPPTVKRGHHSELIQRLLAGYCELCGSTENIEVHHVRAMKDLNTYPGREKPEWVKRMIALRRKTMPLCRTCHEDVTYGRPPRQKLIKLTEVKSLQKQVKTAVLESRILGNL
jgi:group II intron reverse transcriptase/maturase